MSNRDKRKCKNVGTKDLTQCRKCDLYYHELCAGLRCAQCEELFHYKCLQMTSENYEFEKNCSNITFKCDDCVNCSPSVEQLTIDVNKNNKVLLKELGKLQEMNENIKFEINGIKLKINADSNKSCTLEKSRVELRDEMKNFKSELKSSWSEVVGREVKKNVDVINLEVKKNVEVINPEVKYKNVIKLIRIGKKNENVVRPILIKFDDLKIKDLLFKNIYKLKTIGDDLAQVRLSHDLTREQRIKLKTVFEEDQKKNADGKGNFLFKVRGEVGKWHVVQIPTGKT
ncbi:hypothetical protein HELRODRAFT_176070 [Helobdella robusta]|uniref:Zinc finger PHD-type domain-containing protein n=1 Tax=Helobdella robusta TaxID=6412 RepID=T1FA38_HELRO|nr:hypothetical protein HELRODRAFT_176070 [Helobdella robusta]ESO00227.1 hypothetical protein HELRODRAFT_176070 [Helobdella robusta]